MKHLNVAVGIIRNAQQHIFLAQRRADAHMAQRWEFPGGKIEAGETPFAALQRELHEETGIVVLSGRSYQVIEHTYSDRQVTLHFFIIDGWQEEPYGREGQPTRWVAQHELIADDFPSANKAIVDRLLAEA